MEGVLRQEMTTLFENHQAAYVQNTNDYFPILAGIQPAELRRQEATLSLAYHSVMDPKHLLRQLMVWRTTAHDERLQSYHPFVPVARKLLNELFKLSIRAAQWIDYEWDVKYSENQ